MPIYEYRCGKCGDFEVMQKISDKPLGTCPTCRRKVTKLISSTSFQLKGSGWYITDYARKSGASGAADKSGKSEEKKSDSSGTESSKGGDTSASGTSDKPGGGGSGKSTKSAGGKASGEKAAAA